MLISPKPSFSKQGNTGMALKINIFLPGCVAFALMKIDIKNERKTDVDFF